jgi:hypothetical protein
MATPRTLAALIGLAGLLATAAGQALAQAAETAYAADRYHTDATLPLSVYGKPVGYSRSARVDLPAAFDPGAADKAFLWLDVDDIDSAAEAQILLNQTALTDLPPSLLGEGGGHSAWVAVPLAALQPGGNVVTFIFADNLNNTTLGYLILDLNVVVVRQGAAVAVASISEPHERLTIPGLGAVLALGKRLSAAKLGMVKGDELGWKDHVVKVGNDRGGWSSKPADYRFLHAATGKYVFPFGVAQMDNGEIILLAAWHDGRGERPVVAFSKDDGDTWTDWQVIPEAGGRPMMLAYLGKGNLTFYTGKRFFSSDYGRTWPERVAVQPASNGRPWWPEGNPLVDYDANGEAKVMAETTGNYVEANWPNEPSAAFFRRSADCGRTWTREVRPPTWRSTVTYEGKTYERSVCEGSLVRAKNGWLVAALRTDLHPRYLGKGLDDNLCGTAVSISKDDGETWTQLNTLYEAGRHHAHLLRLPNGDILMTLIVRTDIRDGKLASYRRGCEVIVSRDHGVTWDLDRKVVLDEYEFFDGKLWQNGECGHLYSAALKGGRILTVYGNYRTNGATLIRWKP